MLQLCDQPQASGKKGKKEKERGKVGGREGGRKKERTDETTQLVKNCKKLICSICSNHIN